MKGRILEAVGANGPARLGLELHDNSFSSNFTVHKASNWLCAHLAPYALVHAEMFCGQAFVQCEGRLVISMAQTAAGRIYIEARKFPVSSQASGVRNQ
jgi:hypothetical protein